MIDSKRLFAPAFRRIAIYLSSTDTTPVGIFFTEESKTSTLIEISSPSTYAKEEVANSIFTGIDELLNPKAKTESSGSVPNNRVEQENKVDVKEKTGN